MIDNFGMTLAEKIDRAVALLKEWEPQDGYYVAFSGGKDSQCIEWLCRRAGVKFDAHYNNTTIDPPELIAHLRRNYPHIPWNNPERSMMWMVEYGRPGTPPTRLGRWCCEIYKEQGGAGRTTVLGVRAAESPRRRAAWREVTMHRNKRDTVICPIVHWSDEDVWGLILNESMPYCGLYDEGFKRIGCVGCPLAGPAMQRHEFDRWPRYEANWKRAVIGNWARHQPPRMREDGKPYFHASFATGEEFWEWWVSGKSREGPEETCMDGVLYAQEGD